MSEEWFLLTRTIVSFVCRTLSIRGGRLFLITLNAFINGNWDFILFVFVIIVAVFGVILFVHKRLVSVAESRRIRPVSAVLMMVTLIMICGGWFLVQYAEEREYNRTKNIMIGDAPILAYELAKQGYEKITLNTPDNDPQYLRMIQSMVDWMSLNRQIGSLYTLRKLEDGSNVFILGPETDYDGDGYISGDLESRVPIGEYYAEQIPELEEAFRGYQTFQTEVTEDQWGQTISAFVPIFDEDGRQIGLLGLDYDGMLFVKNVALSRLGMIGIVFVVLLTLYAVYVAGVYYVVERQFRRHQEELRYQAYHDSLTGLPNRELFRERLIQAIARLPDSSHSTAVLYLDMDRFKNVNDSLGHSVGDQLLKQLAKRIASCLKEDDLLVRPGGDEYIILINKVHNLEEVLRKGEAILSSFDQPVFVDEYELYMTASIGVSIYPTGGTDADTLIRNADTAMYFAKERGRRLHMYTEDMNERLLERLAIENGLRKGIERGEFVLYYQPKIETSTGKVVGMEALIRWNHPERGFIPPDQFIPVAEDTGLIVPLGEWVLREACRQLKMWEAKGFLSIPIAVNLSSRQFQMKDLVVRIRNIISEFQVNPALLQLELTESCIMQTPELSNHTMYQLKKSGLSIALDDFGTGYSSLSYLRSFPLDVLKIDRGFVKDVTSNPDNAAIVTTIITLAHNLGLKVICEGVETKEQFDFLKGHACDEIQGYYYSRPIPPVDFERWLDVVHDEAAYS